MPVAKIPELRFSNAANQAICFEDQLLLSAINADGTVAYDIGYSLTFLEGGFKAQFVTTDILKSGYYYAMVARDDADRPCVDKYDNALEPHGVTFYVP